MKLYKLLVLGLLVSGIWTHTEVIDCNKNPEKCPQGEWKGSCYDCTYEVKDSQLREAHGGIVHVSTGTLNCRCCNSPDYDGNCQYGCTHVEDGKCEQHGPLNKPTSKSCSSKKFKNNHGNLNCE